MRRFFNVPAALYPWALLVFWQLVMPGASFLGHLCGVLVRAQWTWDHHSNLWHGCLTAVLDAWACEVGCMSLPACKV
jgi:hypothetical protein